MREIGRVKFVQVQRSPMKVGEGAGRYYRADPLQRVDKLLLTVEGIMGLCDDGTEIVDVHHERHPQSRFRGDNKISLGFLPHYDTMRQRFGDHLDDGVGGENILIETDIDPTAANIGARLVIVSQADGNQIAMRSVIPAPPCREFSIFCNGHDLTAPQLRDTLQFLSDGRRGFYAELIENDCQCLVRAGDKLFAL